MSVVLMSCICIILYLVGCKSNNGNEKQLAYINKILLNGLEELQYENDITYRKFIKNTQDAWKKERALKYKPIVDSLRKNTKEAIGFLDSIFLLVKNDFHYQISDTAINEVFARLQLYQIKLQNAFSGSSIVLGDKQFLSKLFLDSTVYPRNVFAEDFFSIRTKEATKATLSSLKSNIKLIEKQVLNYSYWATEPIIESYDHYSALVGQSTSVAQPNEEIQISAGIGSYSRAAQPKIIINNEHIEVDESSVAIYKFKAKSTSGKYIVPVSIEYVKHDGTRDTFNFKVNYKVL